MKKILALLLLSFHLYTAGGYAIVFAYFIHRSEQQITKQIYENKVDATQLVQIKVPVHTPGIKDWPDYERVQGQVQLKDGFYNYVGMKMTHDTIYLVCVANEVKSKLFNATTIMAKNVSDAPLSKKGQDTPVKKLNSPVSEYNIPLISYRFLTFKDGCLKRANFISSILTHPYIESPGKPPNYLIG